MGGIELAGAGLAGERDQVLGDNPGRYDFLDPAFLQPRPGITPEGAAIVSQHAEFPAHLEQHGGAAFQILESELAGPWGALAAMRVGAADLILVAAKQPGWIIGIFQARAPSRDGL